MTNGIDTHVAWNTLDRTPFGWHVVLDVASIWENGIIAGETPTFESLWKIVVHTERPFLDPFRAGVRRGLTFINNLGVLDVASCCGGKQGQ